eukprot:7390329-Prymnesium_polylepis.1
MVCDRVHDEIQGTVGGKQKGEHAKVVDTIRKIEQIMRIADAYRTIHGVEARDYTHRTGSDGSTGLARLQASAQEQDRGWQRYGTSQLTRSK